MATGDPLAIISGRVGKDGRLFLFLDFDGTLVPIRPRPEEARPERGVVELLSSLAGLGGVSVAVLSGRPLAEVREFIPSAGLYRVGCHGVEMEGPGGWKMDAADRGEFRETIAAFRSDASRRIGAVEGAFLEDKGMAIAVHTRLSPRDAVPGLIADLERLGARLLPAKVVETVRGKEVWEIRPAGVNKGTAVRVLLERSGGGAYPVAIGDDRTDRDSFEAVAGSGISILVGEGWEGARADLRLEGPDAVVDLLRRIAEWRADG